MSEDTGDRRKRGWFSSLMLRWIGSFLAVLLAGSFFPGRIIDYGDWQSAAIFAAVLALLNAFVRPILEFISLPLTCITLGLFHLVLAALMFMLAGNLVPDYVTVHGFWGALVGAVFVGLISGLVSSFAD